ncbi:glycoside hydrolase family 32 protein [Ruania suaedae]|uniref:glycoside hydrolase family 32 protein n=1 Tax=Ruania suaedae TaxID=2897774 RepID=UPI001E530EB9|nr:glycoside hydrolase family 32 protein [Ruania suaedae]UFU04335.1 glycoside hydrolase family 32 protein [Ruania suaedae]
MSAPHLDPFPHLHVRPPRGWVNDPNGIVAVDGTWHVFYQYNPKAPVHGNIGWGHATSTDLVTWHDEPVALRPRPGTIDAGGVWSGVATVEDGQPVLVYTAVPGSAEEAGIALARPHGDGWTQAEDFVAPVPPGLRQMRDPFVITIAEHRYGLVGGGYPDGTPVVLVYDAEDLDHWELLGELLTGDRVPSDLRELTRAQIWECPQLLRLPGTDGERAWALILSRWHDEPGTSQLDGVVVLFGDIDPADGRPQFVPRTGQFLDDGPDFYAPQGVEYEDRALLWGWTWETRPTDEIEEAGWAGALTFPRELVLHQGVLHCGPVPELTALRRRPLTVSDPLELDLPAWEVVSGGTDVRVCLTGPSGEREIWSATGARAIRVLVDGSVLEAFVDGRASTVRAYPAPGERWQVQASGAVDAWELGLPS